MIETAETQLKIIDNTGFEIKISHNSQSVPSGATISQTIVQIDKYLKLITVRLSIGS